jgi:hypothetical protein
MIERLILFGAPATGKDVGDGYSMLLAHVMERKIKSEETPHRRVLRRMSYNRLFTKNSSNSGMG